MLYENIPPIDKSSLIEVCFLHQFNAFEIEEIILLSLKIQCHSDKALAITGTPLQSSPKYGLLKL